MKERKNAEKFKRITLIYVKIIAILFEYMLNLIYKVAYSYHTIIKTLRRNHPLLQI